MGLVEFLRDCEAGKCSHHNVFFFYQLLSREEKIKRLDSQKTLQKIGRLGDHIRDHAFYRLVDEI